MVLSALEHSDINNILTTLTTCSAVSVTGVSLSGEAVKHNCFSVNVINHDFIPFD